MSSSSAVFASGEWTDCSVPPTPSESPFSTWGPKSTPWVDAYTAPREPNQNQAGYGGPCPFGPRMRGDASWRMAIDKLQDEYKDILNQMASRNPPRPEGWSTSDWNEHITAWRDGLNPRKLAITAEINKINREQHGVRKAIKDKEREVERTKWAERARCRELHRKSQTRRGRIKRFFKSLLCFA